MYYCPCSDPLTERQMDKETNLVWVPIFYVCWLVCMFVPSPEINAISRTWFVCGILTLILRIKCAVRHDPETTFLDEMRFGFRGYEGIWSSLMFWPLDLFFMRFSGVLISYRDKFIADRSDDLIWNARTTLKTHAAFEISKEEAVGVAKESDEIRRKAHELRESLEAQTLVTCRAGVVAAAVVVGTEKAQAQSVVTVSPRGASVPVRVHAYGWASAVFDSAHPTDNLTLRQLRLRTKVSYENLSLFNESDFSKLDEADSDWMKQSYFNASVPAMGDVRFGRVFLGAAYVLPPPFLYETINFPRMPYTPFAYGIQLDKKVEAWSLLADMTWGSGMTFDDPKQFETIEGSARVEHSFQKGKFKLAGTLQVGGEFARFGPDVFFEPNNAIRIRAAGYVSHKNGTESYGAYGLINYSPLPWLELHCLGDGAWSASRPSFTITPGMRFLYKQSPLSFSVDYQIDPSGKKEGSLFFKGQLKF